MKKVSKPKDLTKLKRSEERARRTTEAIRMLYNAAEIGEQYQAVEPLHVGIETILVPRVRFLVEQLKKAGARL